MKDGIQLTAKMGRMPEILKNVWYFVLPMKAECFCVRTDDEKFLNLQNASRQKKAKMWFICRKYLNVRIIPLFTRLLSHARWKQEPEPLNACEGSPSLRWDNETRTGINVCGWCVCGHPYLVGLAGGVESICSANKQRVFILLQQHLDEVVAFVLQKSKKREEEREFASLERGTFIVEARCGFSCAFLFLLKWRMLSSARKQQAS